MAMNYDAVNRPSSRVSRPPGGTSSNIFGTPDAVQASTRNANNSMKSSIFDSAPEPTKASPPSKRKNPASDASNDIFNVEEKENTAGTDGADVPTKAAVRYNPITGEVVEDAAGDGNAANKKDDEPTPPARNTFQPHQRSHQPPGGRSTFTFG